MPDSREHYQRPLPETHDKRMLVGDSGAYEYTERHNPCGYRGSILIIKQ
jgi:hypothetical protein